MLTLKALKAELLLLLAAVIWGLAFVAQRVGMEHVGPFTYNGVRFVLGALSLLPLLLIDRRSVVPLQPDGWRPMLTGLCRPAAFAGASLQAHG